MNELIKITSENGTPVVSSREVAENFGKQHKDVLEAIRSITAENSALTEMFHETTYQAGTGKQYPMYLMTRDGFTLLAMGFTGKEALTWKLKYIEAFNQMEQQLIAKPACIEDILIQSLQEMKEVKLQIASTNARLDGICEVVALNPTAWREDAKHLISKIALKWGGYDYIKEVVTEVYRLVEARAGANLAMRLENKRRRLADEGVCKSKREKTSKVDVIADDKRLIEIYLAIVKEMAVQNGIGQKSA